jgi:hypothetical protein
VAAPDGDVSQLIRQQALARAIELDTIADDDDEGGNEAEAGRKKAGEGSGIGAGAGESALLGHRMRERRYRPAVPGDTSCFESLLDRYLPLHPRGRKAKPPSLDEIRRAGAVPVHNRLKTAKSRFLELMLAVEIDDAASPTGKRHLTEQEITAKVRQYVGGPAGGHGFISLTEVVEGGLYHAKLALRLLLLYRGHCQSQAKELTVCAYPFSVLLCSASQNQQAQQEDCGTGCTGSAARRSSAICCCCCCGRCWCPCDSAHVADAARSACFADVDIIQHG